MRQDLDHLPTRKRRQLERAVAILFEEFDEALKGKLSPERKRGRILKVILFGSYARGNWVEDHSGGYYSDYDLMVVVSTETFTDPEYWYQAEERLGREFRIVDRLTMPVTLVVHSLDDVNDKLARGWPFFVDVARDGILLYDAPGHPLAAARPLSPEDVRVEAQEYYDDWYSSTVRYFALAQEAMGRGFGKEAAFLLHQTTERAYHCLLLVLTLYSPKLHDIEKLRKLAEGIDPRLIEAWPRNTRFSRRAFVRLKRAYVEARYSRHYTITDEELRWLAERIVHLQSIVAAICAERLAD